MTDTPNEDAWFYTVAGQRRGPVPADTLRDMLKSQTIDGDTPIWRKGLTEWKPLRSTEFAAEVADVPPPVAPTELNNSVVWILAFAPIAYAIIQSWIFAYQARLPGDHQYLTTITYLLPAAVNCILCLLDDRQLREAGYKSASMTFFAVILAPVYLFARARLLRQKPTYGFVWIATCIVSLLLFPVE